MPDRIDEFYARLFKSSKDTYLCVDKELDNEKFTFKIMSMSGKKPSSYEVVYNLNEQKFKCNCNDYKYRCEKKNLICKHILFVASPCCDNLEKYLINNFIFDQAFTNSMINHINSKYTCHICFETNTIKNKKQNYNHESCMHELEKYNI